MMKRIDFKNSDLNELMKETTTQFINDLNSFGKSEVCVALAGGNSTKEFYFKLKDKIKSVKNKKISFFLLDERISTRHRNSSQIKERLGDQDYFFLTKGTPKAQLDDYNKKFNKKCDGFDILIVGVGEDGHIASLFPNSNFLEKKEKEYFLVKESPKPPPLRISVSPKLVSNAKISYLFFIGESKQNAFDNFKNEKINKTKCPAKLVSKTNLRVVTNLK